jgi:lipoprotein-anchoring transpeptidase ErfK/SrfK
VVVVNNDRHLYYVLGGGKAIRYEIAIVTPDEQWTGRTFIETKAVEPSWTPPWDMDNPVSGGDGNPLGARALYLGWSLYRIHGTNAPTSIGGAASHGCIRMFNANIKDLFERVHVGAPVFVVKSLADPRPEAVAIKRLDAQ